MYQVCVVVLCLLQIIRGDLLEALTNEKKGLLLGNGVSLHLDRITKENGSMFETHALRLDYSGMGVSLGKALDSDAVQLKLFVTDEAEGRKREVGDIMIPEIIGFKVTAITTVILTTIIVLVLKAITLAHLGFAVSLGILLSKYFAKKSKHQEEPYYFHEPATHYWYPSSIGYHISNDGYDTIQAAESGGQYSVAEPPTETNGSAVKRFDFFKRRKYLRP